MALKPAFLGGVSLVQERERGDVREGCHCRQLSEY